MKLSSGIKPIFYVKAHAAEIGRTRETVALLKILALGDRQIEEGRVQSSDDVIARLRRP